LLKFGAKLVKLTSGDIMKGNLKVIEHLNIVLTNELTAINQYFLHSRMFKDWGLKRLADYEYHESIDEMKHADWLIERILFLEGIPQMQRLNPLVIGRNTQEMLENDLKLENKVHPDLVNAVSYCEEVKDYTSKELFVKILSSEEEHIDWLETQIGLIKKVGLENYQQENMHSND
jgi:bacterioferritin